MKQHFNLLTTKPKGVFATTTQFGGVDIKQAFKEGISGDIEGVEGNFNGIGDPSAILHKPSDAFEAMRMKSYIESASGSKSSDVTPSGAEPTE